MHLQLSNAGNSEHNNGKGKRLLSLKDLVEEYGVTIWYWRSCYYNREFEGVRAGKGKLLFDRKDIEAYIARNKAFA